MRITMAVACALGLAACGVEKPAEMAKTQEQAKCDATQYPCGPFGYTVDTVIENLKLVGRVDDNGNNQIENTDALVPLELSRYFRDPNVKAIFVGVAAEWCGPCKAEQPLLVDAYAKYKAKGAPVAFLEAIIQDSLRRPADMVVVDRWAKAYKIPFDMASDPAVALGPYYNVEAFPMQMVIRTKQTGSGKAMTIVNQWNGAPVKEIISTIDGVLAE